MKRPNALRRACLGILAGLAAAPSLRAQEEVGEGITIGIERGTEIYWSVQTAEGDDWPALAGRFLAGADEAARLQGANRNAAQPGPLIKIPWALLRADEQRLTALTLFPLDRSEGGDWVHTVGQSEKLPRETLPGVALWFTGKPENYLAIIAANPAAERGLAPGQELRIPRALLAPAFWPPEEFEAWLKAEAAKPRPAPPVIAPAPPTQISPPPASAPTPAPPVASAPASAPIPTPAPASSPGSAPAIVVASAPASAPVIRPPLPPVVPLPGAASAPAPVPPPAPTVMPLPVPSPAARGELDYGRDTRGEFARYQLKAGEALYSAVVIRFMGLVDAPEVNARAKEVARDNAIADVTQIPAGFPLRLRADWLLPQHAPPGSAARLKFEARQRELAQAAAQADAEAPAPLPAPPSAPRGDKLRGVTILLDAGHGGPDPGAGYNGVWESDFVYDITARVKAKLEAETAARVVPIVRDPVALWNPRGAITARTGRIEILSTPPWSPAKGETREAVNQRVRLVNLRAGEDADDTVVFTSFHADALHPSARGAMVYIPDAELSAKKGGAGRSRAERIRAEAQSGRLAGAFIRTLKTRALDVHAFDPVRGYVVRNGHPWVPAVIRDTDLTYKLLIEVCNLANDGDAKNLRDPAFRQKIADAYVETLYAFFGAGPGNPVAKPKPKPAPASPVKKPAAKPRRKRKN